MILALAILALILHDAFGGGDVDGVPIPKLIEKMLGKLKSTF